MELTPRPGWSAPEEAPAGLSPALLEWCRRAGIPPPAPRPAPDQVVTRLIEQAFAS